MCDKQDITSIINAELCCGCGACEGICPAGCISIDIRNQHSPIRDAEKCLNCGLCYEVCPGKGYSVRSACQNTDAGSILMHPKYGPVTGYFRTWATNPKIVKAGTSGGTATAILLYLLGKGLVDDVVLPVLKHGYVEPVITHDVAQIKAAQGSKYVPVPMMRIIADIKKSPRKIAMTCTPCQLAAWKRAEELLPALTGCLECSIGLFCGQVQSYEGIACLAKIMGVDYPYQAEFLGWRCGEYPGNTRFRKNTGEVVDKPVYQSYDILVPYFTLNRCVLCPEGGNWLADMVLGDVHSEGRDQTIVLCRTARGREILTGAEVSGFVNLIPEDEQFAKKTTIDFIVQAKTLKVQAVLEQRRKRHQAVPSFDLPEMLQEYNELRGMKKYWRLRYRLIRYAQRKPIRQWLTRYPVPMESIGRLLYGFPQTFPGWRYFSGATRRIRRYYNGLVRGGKEKNYIGK